MGRTLGVHAHPVANRARGAVVLNIGVQFAIDHQHRAGLSAELWAIPHGRDECIARQHPPRAPGAEEHAVGLHIEIALTVTAINL